MHVDFKFFLFKKIAFTLLEEAKRPTDLNSIANSFEEKKKIHFALPSMFAMFVHSRLRVTYTTQYCVT